MQSRQLILKAARLLAAAALALGQLAPLAASAAGTAAGRAAPQRRAIADGMVFMVTKADDTNDGACNTDCSLREAIIAANAAAGVTVTVDFSNTHGTADDADYTPLSTTVQFAPGETEQVVVISLLDDDEEEPDETITLHLSGASQPTLGAPSLAVLTIVDDDEAPGYALYLPYLVSGGAAIQRSR